jgi:hypothetical protein
MRCGDCVFFSFRHEQCRRHAPTYHFDGARFPALDVSNWCGEFKLDADLQRARDARDNPDTALEGAEIIDNAHRIRLRRSVRKQALEALNDRMYR